jgi:hypothetical protein
MVFWPVLTTGPDSDATPGEHASFPVKLLEAHSGPPLAKEW